MPLLWAHWPTSVEAREGQHSAKLSRKSVKFALQFFGGAGGAGRAGGAGWAGQQTPVAPLKMLFPAGSRQSIAGAVPLGKVAFAHRRQEVQQVQCRYEKAAGACPGLAGTCPPSPSPRPPLLELQQNDCGRLPVLPTTPAHPSLPRRFLSCGIHQSPPTKLAD